MTAASRRMAYTPRSAKRRSRYHEILEIPRPHRAEADRLTAPSTEILRCLVGKDAHDEHDHDTGRR
jgi:hypothetical protein